MTESIEVQGSCDPRFARVQQEFEQAFERGDELGASVCVTLEGETVVDLWAGFADEARTRAWEHDTLVNVYSTTKGIAALVLAFEGAVPPVAAALAMTASSLTVIANAFRLARG